MFRIRAKGGIRPRNAPGTMNKMEGRYAAILELRKLAGEIELWKYEAVKLRLTANDQTFYTPDFMVMLPDGALEFHETKGHWEPAALLRIKFAAEQFPFRFVAMQEIPKKEGGGWKTREFGATPDP